MPDYEAATPAIRERTLRAAAGEVAVAAVVACGIRATRHAGDMRSRERDQRHAEAMAALADRRRSLAALLERTAPQATGQ